MKKIIIILSGIFGLIQGIPAQLSVESRADKNAAWKEYPVEQFSDYPAYNPAAVILNKYGSNTAYKTNATGFFRAEIMNGRWYIIDPEGYTFIHKGVACVSPGTSDNQKAAVISKWGTNDAWCAYANQWLKENNFNGAGAWSDVSRLRKQAEPVPYTVIVHPMSNYRDYHKKQVGGYNNAGWQGYEHNIVRVFDKKFEEYLNNSCKQLSQYKNDKYLIGYFIDNELPWVNDALDRHIKFLSADDECYIAAKSWLDARKGKSATLEDITQADRDAFWDFYTGKFFGMAKDYITRYDPNHMFLGSRFNQGHEELSNPYIFQTAGKYCDIISINHYREWEPIASRMENWESWAGKPFIITEFYTKGEDSGLKNDTGAGWLVKTQSDRGLFYQNFIIKLLKSKGCVGWHWFRYQDNDPDDLSTDPSNRDSNKGLVNIYYEPYGDLIQLVSMTNQNVYSFLNYLNINPDDEELVSYPAADTYLRLLNTETTVHGKEDILRVKNSNGTSYERTSFLCFDFTPYLKEWHRVKKIQFGIRLINIYPEDSDPSSVTMNMYRVNNMTLTEEMANNELLTAYGKRTENLIGSVLVPVNTDSKEAFFTIDVSSLHKYITENPVLTIRLQMSAETSTQFEFASRENEDISSRPYMRMVKTPVPPVSIPVAKETNIRIYNKNASIHIEGIGSDSLITLYNLNGQCLMQKRTVSEKEILIPVHGLYGKILLVNVASNKENETFKLIL